MIVREGDMNIMKMERIGCIMMDDAMMEAVPNGMSSWYIDDVTDFVVQAEASQYRQLLSQPTFAFDELSDEQKQRVKVNLIFSRE
jgi:hypothetical protein